MELPKGHVEIGSAKVGLPYGGVAGHPYHNVRVVISRRGSTVRCLVRETWGSNQGYLEEHGRHEAIGRGGSIHEACRAAENRAKEVGIRADYLAEAMSAAEDEAEELAAE